MHRTKAAKRPAPKSCFGEATVACPETADYDAEANAFADGGTARTTSRPLALCIASLAKFRGDNHGETSLVVRVALMKTMAVEVLMLYRRRETQCRRMMPIRIRAFFELVRSRSNTVRGDFPKRVGRLPIPAEGWCAIGKAMRPRWSRMKQAARRHPSTDEKAMGRSARF